MIIWLYLLFVIPSFIMRESTASARLSHCNSVCPSVYLSVCYVGGSVKNGASWDQQIFNIGCLEGFSFRIHKAFP